MKKRSEPKTIKQKLVQRELAPRAFRHGKPIVMLADYDPSKFSPGEVGVRRTNTVKVAAGPTRKRGRLNGGGAAPGWWKEA